MTKEKEIDKKEAFRRYFPTNTEYVKRIVKISPVAKEWILFEGTNPLRNEEDINWHGVHFDKGYVYHVTPELFEHVKVMKGFRTVKGVKTEIVDFPQKVAAQVVAPLPKARGRPPVKKDGETQ